MCRSFDFNDEKKHKIGASFIGLQPDHSWILSPTLQISAEGNLIEDEFESKYVWLPHLALKNAGSSDVNIASLSPNVHLPLSTSPLKPLLACMKMCFKQFYSIPDDSFIRSSLPPL